MSDVSYQKSEGRSRPIPDSAYGCRMSDVRESEGRVNPKSDTCNPTPVERLSGHMIKFSEALENSRI